MSSAHNFLSSHEMQQRRASLYTTYTSKRLGLVMLVKFISEKTATLNLFYLTPLALSMAQSSQPCVNSGQNCGFSIKQKCVR
jgi:hypothetical protein